MLLSIIDSGRVLKALLAGAAAALAVTAGGCATTNATAVVNPAAARRAIEFRTNAEIHSGRCSGDHQHELEKALNKLTEAFTERTEYAGFKRVGANIVVAREAGATISLDAGVGGEYHIFAYGYSPVQMSIEDEAGNTFQSPSNRAHVANVLGEVPASVELVDAKGDYLITLKGKGCALVAAFTAATSTSPHRGPPANRPSGPVSSLETGRLFAFGGVGCPIPRTVGADAPAHRRTHP